MSSVFYPYPQDQALALHYDGPDPNKNFLTNIQLDEHTTVGVRNEPFLAPNGSEIVLNRREMTALALTSLGLGRESTLEKLDELFGTNPSRWLEEWHNEQLNPISSLYRKLGATGLERRERAVDTAYSAHQLLVPPETPPFRLTRIPEHLQVPFVRIGTRIGMSATDLERKGLTTLVPPIQTVRSIARHLKPRTSEHPRAVLVMYAGAAGLLNEGVRQRSQQHGNSEIFSTEMTSLKPFAENSRIVLHGTQLPATEGQLHPSFDFVAKIEINEGAFRVNIGSLRREEATVIALLAAGMKPADANEWSDTSPGVTMTAYKKLSPHHEGYRHITELISIACNKGVLVVTRPPNIRLMPAWKEQFLLLTSLLQRGQSETRICQKGAQHGILPMAESLEEDFEYLRYNLKVRSNAALVLLAEGEQRWRKAA